MPRQSRTLRRSFRRDLERDHEAGSDGQEQYPPTRQKPAIGVTSPLAAVAAKDRPTDASKAAVCYVRNTSTPAVRCAQIADIPDGEGNGSHRPKAFGSDLGPHYAGR